MGRSAVLTDVTMEQLQENPRNPMLRTLYCILIKSLALFNLVHNIASRSLQTASPHYGWCDN